MNHARIEKCLILPALLLAFLSFLPGPAFAQNAFDFGGSLNVIAGFEHDGDETDPLLEDTLSLWMSTNLGPFSLLVQGSMVNNLDRSYLLDLDTAKLSGRFPGFPDRDIEFAFDLGRFIFADFTGFVLNEKADGLQIEWNFPFTTLSLGAAYTGFVIKPNTTILMSQSDAVDSGTEDVYFAPRRLIETVLLVVPEVFFRGDLRFTWIAQQDLRGAGDFTEPGDRVNTFYAGAGADGSITSKIYYDFFAFAGFGAISESTQILSGFLGGAIRYFRGDALSSRYELRVLHATGEKSADRFYSGASAGESGQFLPISKKDTGIVFSPRMSNITMFELGWSLKPLDPLFVDLRVLSFWRAVAGPISEGGIDLEDASDRYLGFELDGRASWRFYSDFGAAAGLGIFLPAAGTTGAFYDDSIRFKFTLEATIAF